MVDRSEILVERAGPVTLIRFNRPERRNALNMALLHQLHGALGDVAASDALAVVLTGAGDHFCVGADMKAQRDAPTPSYAELAPIYETGLMLHEMKQISFAAIDGGCAGPGLAWAAACDFRFASHRARFNTAFLDVGVSGEMGLAWSLNRIVGPAWTRELLLCPGRFDAVRAQQMGLITRLFEPEELLAQTMQVAVQTAQRPPAALAMMKANILSAERLGLADYIAIEGARHAHLATAATLTKGFAAFQSPNEDNGSQAS